MAVISTVLILPPTKDTGMSQRSGPKVDQHLLLDLWVTGSRSVVFLTHTGNYFTGVITTKMMFSI